MAYKLAFRLMHSVCKMVELARQFLKENIVHIRKRKKSLTSRFVIKPLSAPHREAQSDKILQTYHFPQVLSRHGNVVVNVAGHFLVGWIQGGCDIMAKRMQCAES